MFVPRLLRVANFGVLYAVMGLALTEGVIRAFPVVITDPFLFLLPQPARVRLAEERGLLTANTMVGDGLLFAYKPGIRLAGHDWVTIDSLGYRNPAPPGEKVDVVLLGASIMLTLDARRDLGDLVRDNGLSAYNLGMAGYGPFQSRDAYRRHIIEAGVAHKNLVIMVMAPHSFFRALQYRRLERSGGDFHDFLGAPNYPRNPLPDAYMPWVLSLAVRLPIYFAQEWKDREPADSAEVIIDLPYGTVATSTKGFELWQWENAWPDFLRALEEIIDMAKSAGARPVIMLYPGLGISVLPYVRGYEEERAAKARYFAGIVSRIRDFTTGRGGTFLDLTPRFQEAFGREPVTTSLRNYHPNTRGVEIIFEALAPLLRDR